MPDRTAPLTRTTALFNGGPLIPSRMPERTPLPRRTTPISPKPSPSRALDIATWAACRPVLLDRASGRCEIGGEPVTLATMHGHHRQRREMGDHSFVNGLCLCPAHHIGGPTAVHSHVKDATDHGWIVPTWARPADRWVLLWTGAVVHLTADPTIDGGYAVLTTGEH